MSQRVPSWDVDQDDHNSNYIVRLKPSLPPVAPSKSMSSNLDVPILDYEVAELTWKNGQLAMHGLGPPRVVNKPHTNTTAVTWDKPRAAETLETIVNQATLKLHHKPRTDHYTDELVPWLDHHSSAVAAGASATMTMDALVPSSGTQTHEQLVSGSNTRVGSCSSNRSGVGDHMVGRGGGGGGGGGVATREWSSCREQSGSGSETFGMESSRQLTVDTEKRELVSVRGFTSASMGSREDTVSGRRRSTNPTSPDEHNSVCHSRPQKEAEEKKKGKAKSSSSTKRSRAAAIHNLSERRRRDKINQKMKTLQKLVPNANKTDKASMLDEVIEYLKQLQAQVHVMSRMNISPAMMMPLAIQQQQLQLQMAMMNPMGWGMGMGMPGGVMDLNSNRPNIPGTQPVYHPSAFLHPIMPPWDIHASTIGGDPMPKNDPMPPFLACQSQPMMTMEAYGRMAALFQQMQNQPCYSGLKN